MPNIPSRNLRSTDCTRSALAIRTRNRISNLPVPPSQPVGSPVALISVASDGLSIRYFCRMECRRRSPEHGSSDCNRQWQSPNGAAAVKKESDRIAGSILMGRWWFLTAMKRRYASSKSASSRQAAARRITVTGTSAKQDCDCHHDPTSYSDVKNRRE